MFGQPMKGRAYTRIIAGLLIKPGWSAGGASKRLKTGVG